MNNFNKLDKIKQNKIEAFFKDWKHYKKWSEKKLKDISPDIVMENIKKDHFMKFECFNKLIDFIINSQGNIEQRLIQIIQEISDKYQRKGENIKYEFIYAGQVVLKRKLRDRLIKEYLLSPDDVDILFSKYPKYYLDNENEITFKNNGILWLTWDEKNKDNYPFYFSNNKNEIINVLGLRSFYFDEDLLYLIFNNINMEDVFRPSIADANINNNLWRPTKESFVNYGLTNSIVKMKLKNNYNTQRPEGVIEWKKITFNNLEKSIRSYE